MSKRITIILSDERHKEILIYQAKLMLSRGKSVSFSKAVDLLTGKGLRK